MNHIGHKMWIITIKSRKGPLHVGHKHCPLFANIYPKTELINWLIIHYHSTLSWNMYSIFLKPFTLYGLHWYFIFLILKGVRPLALPMGRLVQGKLTPCLEVKGERSKVFIYLRLKTSSQSSDHQPMAMVWQYMWATLRSTVGSCVIYSITEKGKMYTQFH